MENLEEVIKQEVIKFTEWLWVSVDEKKCPNMIGIIGMNTIRMKIKTYNFLKLYLVEDFKNKK